MASLTIDIQLQPAGAAMAFALLKCHQTQASGILQIEWERFKKQILFRRGEPVATKSNWPAEAFGSFVVRKKIVSPDILRTELAEKEKNSPRTAIGEWLATRGHIPFGKMPGLLEEHFQDRIFNLLALSHGHVFFKNLEEGQIEAENKLNAPLPKLLWEATKILFTDAVCKAKLSPYLSREIRLTGECPLALQPNELRVWNSLQNFKKTLQLNDLELKMSAFASEFQLIEASEDPSEKLFKELKGLDAKHKDASHFEVLGVREEDTVDVCRKAYLELVKKYHPDRLPPQGDASLRQLAERVFGRINEAYGILTDAKKREEYIAELQFKAQGGMEALQEKLVAEMLIPQAKMALRRRHFQNALQMYQKIEKYYADDPEVMADRAFAEYMKTLEARGGPLKDAASRLLEDLRKALSKKSDYALAYYYQGMIMKTEGYPDRALKAFDSALELDPRLVEAASEARLLRMRKK